MLKCRQRPIPQPGEKQQICEKAERVGQQSLSVAPKPVFAKPAASPTIACPGLQCDAGHPTSSLSNSGPRSSRKIFTGSAEFVADCGQGPKQLPVALVVNINADF